MSNVLINVFFLNTSLNEKTKILLTFTKLRDKRLKNTQRKNLEV